MAIEEKILGQDKFIGSEAIYFFQAVTGHYGLSDMDARCLLALYRSDAMPAGSLAKELKVTPGAVTSVIDRLERLGYVRRINDPYDRRKTYIEPQMDKLQEVKLQYKPVIKAVKNILKKYSPSELVIIADFKAELDEILRRESSALRATPKDSR